MKYTGKKYGKLTVVSETIKRDKHGYKIVICECECGVSCEKSTQHLNKGTTKSCGCLRREEVKQHGRKHGDNSPVTGKRTRLYSIWGAMIQRCTNPNSPVYKWYGKKGICICTEWLEYPKFKLWAQSSGYTDNLTIDRIDSNLGYTPDNCRWVTKSENSKNK